MRETQFIQQNKEKWKRFESMLDSNDHQPEELNELFIQITDDLSYARTFYPNRSVRVYLNRLARRVFHNVYSSKKFPMRRLRTFWTEELPRVIWESRQALLLSLVLFIAAFMIGVVSCKLNPEFPNIILGEEYVQMTLENIAKGDPMAVYKDEEMMGMSLGIATNNLRVAFMTVITGILSSIATIFVMLYNGIMVGAFQYFFITQGLFWDSFLTIWIHGALEISAIIIAGGAGMVLGSGLLFPGTYTRMAAFQMSARRGIKIFLGIVPIIILAGIFEGFLTRATEIPNIIRGLFILVNFGFVFYYFIALPWYRARRGDYALRETDEKEPMPKRPYGIRLDAIKSSGTLSSDTFGFISQYTRRLIGCPVLLAMVFTFLSYLFLSLGQLEQIFEINAFSYQLLWKVLRKSSGLLFQTNIWWLLPVSISMIISLAMYFLWKFEKATPQKYHQEYLNIDYIYKGFNLLPIAACFIGIYSLPFGFFTYVLCFLFFPFLGVMASIIWFDNLNVFSALGRALSVYDWRRGIGMGIILSALGSLFFLFLDSPAFSLITEFLNWNVADASSGATGFNNYHITIFFSIFSILISFELMFIGSIFLYFTSAEINTANRLHMRMEALGQQNTIRGLARE